MKKKKNNVHELLENLCRQAKVKNPVCLPGTNLLIAFGRHDGHCEIFTSIVKITTLALSDKTLVNIDLAGFKESGFPLYLHYNWKDEKWILMQEKGKLQPGEDRVIAEDIKIFF